VSTPTTEAPKTDNRYLVKLDGVRLSYPCLFNPVVAKNQDGTPGSGPPKYSASFIMDKATQADLIRQVKLKVLEMLKEHNKGEKLAPDKYCIRDGSFKPGKAGYGEGVEFLTSSNTRKPAVVDRIKGPDGKLVHLQPDDKRLFAGCYVNATVRLWWQENKHGKRINGSLEGVQYVRPGEPFGEAQLEADDMFEGEEAPAASTADIEL
jgi:Protein of unknown function (DUF2815)